MNYFHSLDKASLESFASSLEDILQQEHGVDGRHQLATESSDGFMTASDKKKLNKLLGTSELTSKDSTVIVFPGGGGSPTVVYTKAGVIFNALNAGTELDLEKTFSGTFDPKGDYAITFRCVDPTTVPEANVNLTLIKSANKIIFKPDYDGAKIEWKITEIVS